MSASESALGDRRAWWKLSDSCHQHAWHQVDTCVFEGGVT
jgi:hypothetical protein